MKHRCYLLVTVGCLIFAVALFSFIPLQSAEVEGGVAMPNGNVGYVHYEHSLSCQMIPFGVYYLYN